jgi:hypothetical protein
MFSLRCADRMRLLTTITTTTTTTILLLLYYSYYTTTTGAQPPHPSLRWSLALVAVFVRPCAHRLLPRVAGRSSQSLGYYEVHPLHRYANAATFTTKSYTCLRKVLSDSIKPPEVHENTVNEFSPYFYDFPGFWLVGQLREFAYP